MITKEELKDLQDHLQTAIDVELSTIPIYLYTFYSVRRKPIMSELSTARRKPIGTFCNKLGAVIMSVAMEEMLHLALVSNLLKALGGSPKIYGRSPQSYPTNLSHHKKGFSIGLKKFSEAQLMKFMEVEQPAPFVHEAQGDNWDTLGQFYEYIAELIEKTEDSDYAQVPNQLPDDKGYYAPNNVDTIYPDDNAHRSASSTHFSNSDYSGGLMTINSRADALAAIKEITEQGEGYSQDPTHQFSDAAKLEESHWYKYKELLEEYRALKMTEDEMETTVFEFPDNPTKANFPEEYGILIELSDAIYAYMLWITEISYTLEGSAQFSMFYIGMHKAMIFILDKFIGKLRGIGFPDANGELAKLAPTFRNYEFKSIKTAKQELVALAEKAFANPDWHLGHQILDRIKDLPDVHVVQNKVSFT